MPDLLANVFDLLEVKTAVYFLHDFVSPWGLRIPGRPHSQFQLLLYGTAVIEVDTQEITLAAGDLVLFLNGTEHKISDGLGTLRDSTDAVPRMVRGEKPFGQSPKLERDSVTNLQISR